MSKKNTFWGKDRILRIISNEGSRVHFVGVGGAGMSSLFCLTRHFGIFASGSDAAESDFLREAIALGEDVWVGERRDAVEGASLVVYSLAISDNNTELAAAEERGIPTVSRADYMSALAACYAKTVAISGSHGKSTTTAMLYSILKEALRAPTVMCGAEFLVRDDEVRRLGIGSLDYLVYESCEYKDSFLAFRPDVALFLNLELDHTDYFKDIGQIKKSFAEAIKKARLAIINGDDKNLRDAAESSGVGCVTYGEGAGCDYRYSVLSTLGGAPRFSLFKGCDELGEIRLSCIGRFNAANGAGAICSAMEMGIPFEVCKRGVESFMGAKRRLEKIGLWQGRCVYYDYAHHPTEIRAVINAVKEAGESEVTVIFCAHTYSRTEAFFLDFVSALSLADYLVLTEIDGVRESGGRVNSEAFAKSAAGVLVRDEGELFSAIKDTRGPILLMGAGNCEWVKKFLTNT